MFKSSFEKNLESATSHLRLEPDWPAILVICDEINQKDISAKNAFAAIKKKMNSQNPHSSCYALLVLESVVKNCGPPMQDEVFTKENCEMFSSFLEKTPHDNVRKKMLELVQTWANAFRSSEKYQAIKDTMTILKTKGHKFPELKEADAMFTADTAPNWADGQNCHRCRDEFTFINRKHHCRNCGQAFCGQCSSKQCPLLKFGIEKDVRVCDGCYAELQRPAKKSTALRAAADSDLPAEYLNSSLAQQVQTPPPRKSQTEIKEEEELQLALALSQSEAEQKKQEQTQQSFANMSSYRFQQRSPSPEAATPATAAAISTNKGLGENYNPDLAKYLNRAYWEQRKTNEPSPLASPSAPSPMPSVQSQNELIFKTNDEQQIDEFAANMRTQVEIFVNRMKSNSSRGRSSANDSSVQTLFMTLTSLHSQQLSYIKEMDDKRMWYEQLQDKLAQIKDSRAALDVLRQEHIEKLRLIAEEQERQRQIQMAQKLDIMRKKKQEYLQYQRQLALQRIQDQEREMQLRQEQQKAQYRMGQNIFNFMPGHSSPSHSIYNPYANYGPSSGTLQAPPGMYNPAMQPPQNATQLQQQHQLQQPQHMMMPGQMLPMGMMPMPGMSENGLPNASQPMLQQTQHQQQQQQQQPPQQQTATAPPATAAHVQQLPHPHPHAPQQQQQQEPQLTHVMLQQQHVIHSQSPIPNVPQMPMSQPPNAIRNETMANAQLQAVAAAPAPPINEPEPTVAAAMAAAPAPPKEEPATAELISFD